MARGAGEGAGSDRRVSRIGEPRALGEQSPRGDGSSHAGARRVRLSRGVARIARSARKANRNRQESDGRGASRLEGGRGSENRSDEVVPRGERGAGRQRVQRRAVRVPEGARDPTRSSDRVSDGSRHLDSQRQFRAGTRGADSARRNGPSHPARTDSITRARSGGTAVDHDRRSVHGSARSAIAVEDEVFGAGGRIPVRRSDRDPFGGTSRVGRGTCRKDFG